MNLVIVESPAKARTIQKYLGKNFVVKSSFGHVRDLPKSTLGVEIDKNFAPHYVALPKARTVIKELQTAAKKADTVYFATDEDREGEAIAWHLLHSLKISPDKAKRITFTEITKDAITHAVSHPRPLDTNLVNAQQARRILDRLVGYELSPLLWKKIRRGLSAGRVQSVAVRLIAEREQERQSFQAQEYWSLTAHLSNNDQPFTAMLKKYQDTVIGKLDLKNEAQVNKIVEELNNQPFQVGSVVQKERQKNPLPPFTTSTLQQTAFNTLGFSSKKTMLLAQQLYEGVDVGQEGPVGLITYMRTDSVSLSQESLRTAHQVITENFGKDFALPTPRQFTTKSKGAQEAHEAIRPTHPGYTPEKIGSHLKSDQLKLYRLIWQRFMASQMAAARLVTVAADITAGQAVFRATGSTIHFAGYLKVWPDIKQQEMLPALQNGDTLQLDKLKPEQHFTQPPPRYSEATLVKALEEKGIGRPSTYAPIIDTIQRREYVVKGDDKRFQPTEIGVVVNKLLTTYFPNIVDIDFTAKVENGLDEIAAGHLEWQPMIANIYHPLHDTIQKTEKSISKQELTQEKTGESCPKCGHELVIKLGRFGKFKACSNYPECKHAEAIGEEKKLQDQLTEEKCPDCGKNLVVKRGRFGIFLGCSGYPDCKYIKKIEKDTGVVCPKCQQGKIVEKRSRRGRTFYGCNRYPDCDQAFWSKPTGEKCPQCSSLLVFGAKNTIRCSNKDCDFKQENPA